MIAKRSTRLMAVGQALAPWRRVGSVTRAAMALGYFLEKARFPMRSFATRLLETAVRMRGSDRLESDRGKVLVVIDPTEYAKRSRRTGTRGRGMLRVGRVRKAQAKSRGKKRGATAKEGISQPKKVATSDGSVEIWAGLVLVGKGFLSLARQRFSSTHPKRKRQNRGEAAVLFQALGVLRRVGLDASVVGDRGWGRKELVIRLVHAREELVVRIAPDILVRVPDLKEEILLAELLARQPDRGEVIWDGGDEGRLRWPVRKVRATSRFRRSGRKADDQEAMVNFLEVVPVEEGLASLVLATTLPVPSLADARGIARVYAQRWARATGFETLHGGGQDRFMVRSFDAIDRLLWMVALAHALVMLALRDGKRAGFRDQAIRLLKQQTVLGRRLTVGKLALAIGLDFDKHRRAWAYAWLL